MRGNEAGSLEPVQPADGRLEKNGYHRHDPVPHQPAPPPPQPRSRRSPIWRSLALPVAVAAVCGAVGYFTAKRTTPVYSASTTIWFPATSSISAMGSWLGSITGGPTADPTGSVPVLGGLYNAPQLGSGPSTAMAAMSTFKCQSEVVKNLKLAQRWHVPPAVAAGILSKNVNYGVDRNGFLAVQVTDTDPKMSVKIINAYIDAMRDVTTQMSMAYTERIHEAVQKKYDQAYAQLMRQNAELVAFQTGSMARLPLGDKTSDAYADLSSQKIAATNELSTVQAQIAEQRTLASRAASSSGLPSSSTYATAQIANLRKLESDWAFAQETLGPDNPQYQEAHTRLIQARAQLHDEMTRQLKAVSSGIAPGVTDLYVQQASLQAKIEGLTRALGTLRQDVVSMPATKMRQDELTAEISVNREAVRTLAVALQQVGLAEQRDVPTFQVVDAATVPASPILPRPLLTAAFAAVAGFLLAMAWQIGRAVLRQPKLVGEVRRWTEKYIVMDPLAEPEPAPALETEPLRRSFPVENRPALMSEAVRPGRAEEPADDADMDHGRKV